MMGIDSPHESSHYIHLSEYPRICIFHRLYVLPRPSRWSNGNERREQEPRLWFLSMLTSSHPTQRASSSAESVIERWFISLLRMHDWVNLLYLQVWSAMITKYCLNFPRISMGVGGGCRIDRSTTSLPRHVPCYAINCSRFRGVLWFTLSSPPFLFSSTSESDFHSCPPYFLAIHIRVAASFRALSFVLSIVFPVWAIYTWSILRTL